MSSFAVFLAQQGRSAAAVAEARDAVGRDPLSAFGRHFLAVVLYMARQFEAAIDESNAGLELEPNSLKVLPQAFTDDSHPLARFEREAKVLASLNHPVSTLV